MDQKIIEWSDPVPVEGVSVRRDGHRLRLRAERDLDGLASGVFAQPTIGVAFRPTDPWPGPGAAYLGFGFGQFALPVRGGPRLAFDWSPAGNVDSPPAVVPLLMRDASGAVALLAPLDAWHDQIIAVEAPPGDDGADPVRFRWGWHGDLDRIPAGTVATLGCYEADTASAAFARWRADLAADRGGTLPDRPADPVTTALSYWTDNGAAYWYRTESGRDVATTLADKLAELDDLGVAVGAVELDSWFYPHELSRPVTDVDYPDEVPPTGMLAWTPRADVVPDGVADLGRRLGRRPLTVHARHISARSPYVDDGDWWVDDEAHPADPAFFERWAADAASWGATCIEQDWMLATWFGVRQLRAEPGRAAAWLRGLDDAAARHHLTLLLCMSTPADLLATVDLTRITAVRTCDDYRYADDPARLWRWYLTVNRLAGALALPTSKDCFFTSTDPGPSGLDGDPDAEVECVLAALSAGVGGIGDRIGRTDTALVARLARPDGILAKPDRAIALCDGSLFDTAAELVPTWAETVTATVAGTWRYIVALHLADGDDPVSGTHDLDRPHLVYNWRTGAVAVASSVTVELGRRDWAQFVCCPLPGDGRWPEHRPVPIGDPTVHATMAPTRVELGPAGALRPVLASGEDALTVRFWSVERGLHDETLG